MSFGFSIGDIIAISTLTNTVRKRFVDSPNEFRVVSDEVKSLSNVLRDLEDIFPERSLNERQQADLKDYIKGCDHVLKDLDRILDRYHDLDSATRPSKLGKKPRRLWKRLKWEPDDVKELRSRLTSNVGLLNAFTTTLSIGLAHATKVGVDQLTTHQDETQYRALLEWLSPAAFAAQQSDIFRGCQEGTGQWLLESQEYKVLLEGKESTLFCPGIPGAGKTMLTSIVVNSLQERFKHEKMTGVTYFYCSYKRQGEQNVEYFMANLLKQLLQARHTLREEVKTLHERNVDRGTRPSLSELLGAVDIVLGDFTRVFVLIDALDEYSEKTRSRLLKELLGLQSRQYISLFITSRYIPEIMADFKGLSLEIRATDEDVRRYLTNNMTELPTCVQKSHSLQKVIVTEITRAVEGMFLLAQLHLGSLSDKTTVKAVKLALQELPKGSKALNIAYKEALERIESQKHGFELLAKEVLSWIVCAVRQLTVPELQHALAVEEGASELDEDNLPEPDEMVAVCAGLVTVDEESKVIRLVHYTTQQYFERTLAAWAPWAHVVLANTCLTYLSFESIGGGCTKSWENNEAIIKFVDSVKQFIDRSVLSFLGDEFRLENYSRILLGHLTRYTHHRDWVPTRMTAMHLTAYLGLEKAACALLNSGQAPDLKNSRGETPLLYSTREGHLAVSKLLINRNDVEVNTRDEKGQTALSLAAENGHETIVNLLLNRGDVTIDFEDIDCRTPLSYEAENGHTEITKRLLGKGADMNSKDNLGKTPISYAAAFGHELIIMLLLGRGSVADHKDLYERTPLMEAVQGGHEGAVKLLLECNDVDINARDEDGNTPCSETISCAQRVVKGVARRLFERQDIQVNLKNPRGETLLMLATLRENETVAEILLERGEIEVNATNWEGDTALMIAAREKRIIIARLLLKRKDIEVNMKNRRSQTALSLAAAGDAGILALLLERDDTLVNSKSPGESSALLVASQRGLEEVVELLLTKKEIEVNFVNQRNQTALILAAREGQENVVNLLLARDDIELNHEDKNMKTALMWATDGQNEWVEYRYLAVVSLLLARAEIRRHSTSYRTTLILLKIVTAGWISVEATRYLCALGCARLASTGLRSGLITHLGRNLRTRGYRQATTFRGKSSDKPPRPSRWPDGSDVGCETGTGENRGVVTPDTDAQINLKNNHDQTALIQAAYFGESAVVSLLLGREEVEINCRDKDNRSAVIVAAERGNYSVVDLLEYAGAEKQDRSMQHFSGWGLAQQEEKPRM